MSAAAAACAMGDSSAASTVPGAGTASCSVIDASAYSSLWGSQRHGEAGRVLRV